MTQGTIDPKKDYIAIAFKGGTGGKFLCSWLTKAKLKNTKVNFTPEGSAGFSEFELKHDFEKPSLLDIHIKKLHNNLPEVETFSPYFLTTTVLLPEKFADEVYKLILITYDLDDVDLIFKFYCAKNFIFKQDVSFKEMSDMYRNILNSYYKYLQVGNKENITKVSFKDLLFANPTDLVNKLATVTGLSQQDFNIELLQKWRTKSLEGAEIATEQLKDFYERNSYISQNALCKDEV